MRAIVALLAGCAVIALGAEAVARIGVDRASRIQRHLVEEYRAARAIGQDDQSRPHVLVVGNSLLDEGVNFGELRRAIDGWDARRFVVEQTYYYDWYYGLKRLFREGARPDVVVVMLSAGQWTADSIRGDYSAQYLFSLSDLPAVARDLHLHPTEETGLFAAGVSKFWAARAEIRNFALGRVMPNVGELMRATAAVNTIPYDPTSFAPLVRPRIERLNALAAANGARLLVLVPPVLSAADGGDGILDAARQAGVRAIRPVVSGTYDRELFRDGFHLNDRGAALFTARLTTALREELDAMHPLPRDARAGAPDSIVPH